MVTRVLFHVTDGVDVHHQRHERHHQHHHYGERVDQEADLKAQTARGRPRVQRTVEGVAVNNDILRDHATGQQSHRHTQDGGGVGASAADGLAEQAGKERPGERSQRNEQIKRLHGHGGQPLRVLMSSTLMVRKLRNSTTRIARPMADSAAATVKIKNTNTCPEMSCR